MRPQFIGADDVQILDSPEDVLTTLGSDGKRKWLYPTPSEGRYTQARRILAWVLIVLYIALPIIPIGGNPALMLDFVHREFHIFGLTFYPTDTMLLMFFGIGIILIVVFGTAVFGRVWCGWACPQTVYLEFVFRPIERLTEGKEHVRKRRNEGPWTLDKFWRRSVKLGIYLALSLVLAHTFVAYFVGWENLLTWMVRSPYEHPGFFVMMAITTGLVMFDFTYFREQMCTIACPYARMQSVLLDKDSLIVSYDSNRGEPRARRSKKKMALEAAGEIPAQGDCIDCFACVRTCPTGIDIRDGLQMECVACTQCIDACDDIMDKIGKPHGLIRYTSENSLEGKTTRILRPRTALYTAAFVVIAILFSMTFFSRGSFDVDIARAVGEPYTVLPDDRIANRVRFRVRNLSSETATFTVTALSPADAELRVVGQMPVTLEGGEMTRLQTWIIVEPDLFDDNHTQQARFRLDFSDGSSQDFAFPLLGPSTTSPQPATSSL